MRDCACAFDWGWIKWFEHGCCKELGCITWNNATFFPKFSKSSVQSYGSFQSAQTHGDTPRNFAEIPTAGNRKTDRSGNDLIIPCLWMKSASYPWFLSDKAETKHNALQHIFYIYISILTKYIWNQHSQVQSYRMLAKAYAWPFVPILNGRVGLKVLWYSTPSQHWAAYKERI